MRRANGTGSIVNLGPNRRNRYAIRISYQERPGLWKQKYLSYHRTAKEAQAALEAVSYTHLAFASGRSFTSLLLLSFTGYVLIIIGFIFSLSAAFQVSPTCLAAIFMRN